MIEPQRGGTSDSFATKFSGLLNNGATTLIQTFMVYALAAVAFPAVLLTIAAAITPTIAYPTTRLQT
jgi:hypothetical protein